MIDGQCVKLEYPQGDGDHQRTFYGCNVIESGVFSWKIKFLCDLDWICIGIIEDDIDVLKRFMSDGCSWFEEYGCFMLCEYFYFGEDEDDSQYCDYIEDEGTVITMTLDLDNTYTRRRSVKLH